MSEQPREVRLIGFPLAIHRQATEHFNELMREFSLIAVGEQHSHDPTVPLRLLELVEALTRDFSGVTDAVDAERDAAAEAGLESIDLTYHVPLAAGEASHTLGAMLDEADEFCRSGGALLTLATPPRAKAFRDWYLQEFIGQLAGADPIPWPEYEGTVRHL